VLWDRVPIKHFHFSRDVSRTGCFSNTFTFYATSGFFPNIVTSFFFIFNYDFILRSVYRGVIVHYEFGITDANSRGGDFIYH
jgi:hypothetical protein